ncbi:uncharacterized protein M421DRAFT_317761 [Didymella exigua CBS 183.55]|uniref:Uncharacterized protein n=1 Tax=Didymella exigua CBS 183.55 TaxID=1150837 RepID=A0A6A5RT78_9PLEO|nr:uncharacterized protein M421DRAFT_317761 [Didymella exigua CBS 183.55]KAF1931675.1 hypothetical protein M421DRAFT_317761 [Didymella exigua CBS 183.55]
MGTRLSSTALLSRGGMKPHFVYTSRYCVIPRSTFALTLPQHSSPAILPQSPSVSCRHLRGLMHIHLTRIRLTPSMFRKPTLRPANHSITASTVDGSMFCTCSANAGQPRNVQYSTMRRAASSLLAGSVKCQMQDLHVATRGTEMVCGFDRTQESLICVSGRSSRPGHSIYIYVCSPNTCSNQFHTQAQTTFPQHHAPPPRAQHQRPETLLPHPSAPKHRNKRILPHLDPRCARRRRRLPRLQDPFAAERTAAKPAPRRGGGEPGHVRFCGSAQGACGAAQSDAV